MSRKDKGKRLTVAMEDYLKCIYSLERKNQVVSNSLLADKMEVSPASATAMIKKLAELTLAEHEPYHGVRLTESGLRIALEITRHHRLIELYLSETLGVPWDKVHDEAEKWEHVLSEDLEDRMDKVLGHPTRDPHGSPIPSRDGHIEPSDHQSLVELEAGASGEVVEVSDHDADILRYFTELGIGLKTKLTILKVEPFDGPLTIKIGDNEQVLGRAVAEHIFVN
jgi:DtxR family Mn-dependent transcriptional regulator